MPFNKSEKTQNQHNQSSIREEAIAPRAAKFAKKPPSLNGIKKQP